MERVKWLCIVKHSICCGFIDKYKHSKILTKRNPEICMWNFKNTGIIVRNKNIMCMFRIMKVKNVCVVKNNLMQSFSSDIDAFYQLSLVIYWKRFSTFLPRCVLWFSKSYTAALKYAPNSFCSIPRLLIQWTYRRYVVFDRKHSIFMFACRHIEAPTVFLISILLCKR